MFDILIKGGSLLDGSGVPATISDIAVVSDRIVAIGPDLKGEAREIIDAAGKTVTPGFIDGHTHFDAQISWDDVLEPSASHGVTTLVIGNCGVGFAPVRPNDHDRLIDLMEGVEDIPGTALHEGLRWSWQTFPEYLSAIADRQYSMDVAALVPHGPLRLYVMRDRAIAHEAATQDDIAAMSAIVGEAVAAGAIGFSTSRVLEHQAINGDPVPGTFASEDELLAIANALRTAGRGVLQAIPAGGVGGEYIAESANVIVEDVAMLARIATSMNVPVIFSLMQAHDEPEAWREILALTDRVAAEGGAMHPMVAPRAVGLFSGWCAYHAFQRREAYLPLADLPLDERVAELRKPEIKDAILKSADISPASRTVVSNLYQTFQRLMSQQYLYDDEVDFEPTPGKSLGGIADAAGQDVESTAYDAMLAMEGRALLFNLSTNYASSNYDNVAEMLEHPATLLGLGDAGAHVRVICDAANPTFALTFWGRDRVRGRKLPIPLIVRKLTLDQAKAFGFSDRGKLAVGLRADINVIDLDRLRMTHPYMVSDLPEGGDRLLQGAEGYEATIVGGVVTRRHDRDTGARPGRLVRSAAAHGHVETDVSVRRALQRELA